MFDSTLFRAWYGRYQQVGNEEYFCFLNTDIECFFLSQLLVGESGACRESDDHASSLVWQVDQGKITG